MRISQQVRAQIAMLAAIAIADAMVRLVHLPNPAAVTLLGVVTAAFMDGARGGLTGTAISFIYSLYRFWPLATEDQQWRAGTILVSGVVMALLVGKLRRRSDLILRQAVELEKEKQYSAERERHVADLRQSEERNRAFFELAGAGFAEVDANTGRFIRVNRKLEEITGYTAEELLVRTFLDITHPDDRHISRRQYEEAGLSGNSFEAEKRYLRKSGEVRWVRKSIRLVRDAAGQPSFSSGIIIDVSDTHAANQALVDANARLRRLVDSNIVGVVIGRPDGVIEEANDAYLAMLGYSREEWLAGRIDWRSITPAEYLPMEGQAIAEASERGACTPYEKEYVRRDGSRIPVLIGFATIPEPQSKYIAFVIDLTDQKAAEAREHTARAEAERANRAKDEFLAVVSHELRTPMTSILGWATMLENGVDSATTREGLRLLAESARLEARLIDDLLDFSRAVSGKLAIHSEELDLSVVALGTAANIRPLTGARGIQFSVDTPPQPVIVRGDEQRLYQVVWNLLTNGVKFTPRGGRVDLALECSDGEARLSVSDSGRGISPAFLPHVFDWFAQEDPSTTREAGGLGLGLAIVRYIVGIHGGRVEAFSEGPGRGARFVVHLQLAAPAVDIEQLAPAETKSME
jgi:PAS domain S-box-containing protein